MTPGARVQAAIEIVGDIDQTGSTEQALTRWARRSRFAGSKDRAAIRDIVFEVRRRWDSCAIAGQGTSARARILGLLYIQGLDPDEFFTGAGHAPAARGPDETPGNLAQSETVPDMPSDVFSILAEDHGTDVAWSLARELKQRAPVTVRVHAQRSTPEAAASALGAEGILARPHPFVPTALIVTENARRLVSSAPYLEGLIELQDAASQKAAEDVPGGTTVLDYCAGGGGKSLALAARSDVGAVFAHDIDPGRMGDLPKRAARAQDKVSLLRTADLKDHVFDTVVVDAPCTGSGTWRRAPDAKWASTRLQVDGFADRQLAILTDAARHVSSGGALCYMTCSVFSTENQGVVGRFLSDNLPWRLETEWQLFPEDSHDGFYLAILLR